MKFLLLVAGCIFIPVIAFAQYGANDTVSPPPVSPSGVGGAGGGGTPQKYEWCRMTLVRCLSVDQVKTEFGDIFKDDLSLQSGNCPDQFLAYKTFQDCRASFAYKPTMWAIPVDVMNDAVNGLGLCKSIQDFGITEFVNEKYGVFDTQEECQKKFDNPFGKKVWCIKEPDYLCKVLEKGQICAQGSEFFDEQECLKNEPPRWCKNEEGVCINKFLAKPNSCKTPPYKTQEECSAAVINDKPQKVYVETTFDASILNQLGTVDVKVYIGRIVKAAMGILGSITLVMFVYSGILFMTDRGSGESVGKAKEIAVWTSLGLVVIFASYAILNFIFQIFGT